MTSRPEQQFLDIALSGENVQEAIVEKLYNELGAVSPVSMIGTWVGGNINTGHVGCKQLEDMRWAGKEFRSTDDGDPIIVYDDNHNRVWNKDWGHSSVGASPTLTKEEDC